MVVGAWLLTLVLASPQVNKQVQIVPKKFRIEILAAATLSNLKLYERGASSYFYLERPCQNHIFPRR